MCMSPELEPDMLKGLLQYQSLSSVKAIVTPAHSPGAMPTDIPLAAQSHCHFQVCQARCIVAAVITSSVSVGKLCRVKIFEGQQYASDGGLELRLCCYADRKMTRPKLDTIRQYNDCILDVNVWAFLRPYQVLAGCCCIVHLLKVQQLVSGDLVASEGLHAL